MRRIDAGVVFLAGRPEAAVYPRCRNQIVDRRSYFGAGRAHDSYANPSLARLLLTRMGRTVTGCGQWKGTVSVAGHSRGAGLINASGPSGSSGYTLFAIGMKSMGVFGQPSAKLPCQNGK